MRPVAASHHTEECQDNVCLCVWHQHRIVVPTSVFFVLYLNWGVCVCVCVCVCVWLHLQMWVFILLNVHEIRCMMYLCVYCMFYVWVKPALQYSKCESSCQWPQQISLSATTKKENEFSPGAQLSASQLQECVCVCMCACLILHTWLTLVASHTERNIKWYYSRIQLH